MFSHSEKLQSGDMTTSSGLQSFVCGPLCLWVASVL